MPEFGVPSEVSELRRVLTHQPGAELELANRDPMTHSFRSHIDVRLFTEQHMMLTQALREAGVEVLDVGFLVSGDSFASRLVRQCPNLVYTRDSCTITDAGAILFKMGLPSRRDETPVIRAALREAGVPVAHQTPEGETLEGGSFILLGDRASVAALTRRATQKGIGDLQEFLLSEQLCDQFIQLNPPEGVTHIDTELAELPGKRILIHGESLFKNPATIWTRTDVYTMNLREWLRGKGYDVIEITEQERDELACDLLTVSSDLVIHSTGNPRVIGEIKERGIDVAQVPGEELRKGNGGVHCMTCPILRN